MSVDMCILIGMFYTWGTVFKSRPPLIWDHFWKWNVTEFSTTESLQLLLYCWQFYGWSQQASEVLNKGLATAARELRRSRYKRRPDMLLWYSSKAHGDEQWRQTRRPDVPFESWIIPGVERDMNCKSLCCVITNYTGRPCTCVNYKVKHSILWLLAHLNV